MEYDLQKTKEFYFDRSVTEVMKVEEYGGYDISIVREKSEP